MPIKEGLNKSNAPSPLMGEGWGEGEKSMPYPSPQPSPARGEGVNQTFLKGMINVYMLSRVVKCLAS